MSWPEPSGYDCGADWSMEEIEGDNGEVIAVRCGCYCCKRARREAGRDYDED